MLILLPGNDSLSLIAGHNWARILLTFDSVCIIFFFLKTESYYVDLNGLEPTM